MSQRNAFPFLDKTDNVPFVPDKIRSTQLISNFNSFNTIVFDKICSTQLYYDTIINDRNLKRLRDEKADLSIQLIIETLTQSINTIQLIIETLTQLINTIQLIIKTLTQLMNTIQLVIETLTQLINTIQLVIETLTQSINKIQLVIETLNG